MPKTYADLTVANATAGNAILASDFSTLFTNSNNYRRPPLCVLAKNISLTNAGVVWDFPLVGDEEVDTDDMHSISSNTARITPSTAGVYLVTASTDGVGNYSVSVQIRKNGTSQVIQSNDNGTYTTAVSAASVFTANGSTDYFDVLGYSTTPGTYKCRFTATWLGQAT